MDDEVPFEDGNVSEVVRVGTTVRRGTGRWTPAIHALLRHLERVGFAGAPRVLGIDAQGREILTFVVGTTDPSPLIGFQTEAELAEAAYLLRCYHDATTTFTAPEGSVWHFQVGAPMSGDVVCHNDIAPWNTVVADGHPRAFIDWDLAAPAPRLWDIAHALWRFAPLYPDAAFGTPAEQAQRMKLFCDAYGLADRRAVLDTIERRQQVLYRTVAEWGQAGVPGFARLWQEGHAEGVLSDLAYLRQYRADFERGLA